MERENPVVDKSLKFGLAIIHYCEELETRKRFVVSNQLLKCGTSIGANIHEAQHAESKSDFIHKMKIALKEAGETNYWLTLCEKCDNFPPVNNLRLMVDELIRIISKIIVTSKTTTSIIKNSPKSR